MYPDPEKIWKKFVELLNLDNHGGNIIEAAKHPVVNLYGSIESHKKFFDQAVSLVTEDEMLTGALMDGEYDVGGEG